MEDSTDKSIFTDDEIAEVKRNLQLCSRDPSLLDPDDLDFLKRDESNGRYYMGKKKRKQLDSFFNIFPWVPVERIRDSGVTPEELRDALHYFARPFTEDECDEFVSHFSTDRVYNFIRAKAKLRAVVEMYNIYCVNDMISSFADDADDEESSPSESDNLDNFQWNSLRLPGSEMCEIFGDDLVSDFVHSNAVPTSPSAYTSDAYEPSDVGDIPSDWEGDSTYFPRPFDWRDGSAEDIPPPALESRVDDLEGRVDNLEEGTTTMPGGKRIRSGRDRAAWMRIKRSHMHDRDMWCKPGAVMGVFPRGIGPLDGSASIHKILQVVVYSTDPDTIEEFPAGADRREWAPIVMIGEAPVALTDYSKYKRGKLHKKNSTVYVHLLSGRVEVCEGLTVPEYCFRLGTATAGHSIIGEGGFPYFQNTKGVCTAIENTNFTSNPVFPATRLFVRNTLRNAKLAKKKVKKRAKNHDGTFLKTIVSAVSSLTLSSSSSSSPKPLVKHDITLIVTEHVEDIGIALGITSNGERVEVAAVREGSSAASLGVVAGDRVKNAAGWDNEGDNDPNRLLNYIQSAPRPLKIVIRHKGFAPANDSAPDSKKGDGKKKKSK